MNAAILLWKACKMMEERIAPGDCWLTRQQAMLAQVDSAMVDQTDAHHSPSA